MRMRGEKKPIMLGQSDVRGGAELDAAEVCVGEQRRIGLERGRSSPDLMETEAACCEACCADEREEDPETGYGEAPASVQLKEGCVGECLLCVAGVRVEEG